MERSCVCSCPRPPHSCLVAAAPAQQLASAPHNYIGFDANDYPGDALLPALRKQFAFTGYWLTNPPGATTNPWVGKRDILLRNGFGFLVVANGRLGQGDPPRTEVRQASRRARPRGCRHRRRRRQARRLSRRSTILFLDQEEGGRLLPEQADYLLAWTEAVAATAYRPGVYASGQPVPDGKGPDGKPVTITTIQDIRQHVAAQHLHPIAFWVMRRTPARPRPAASSDPAHAPAPDLSGTLDADRLAVRPVSAPTNPSPRPAARLTTATATATPPASPTSHSTSASPPHPTPPTAADYRPLFVELRESPRRPSNDGKRHNCR